MKFRKSIEYHVEFLLDRRVWIDGVKHDVRRDALQFIAHDGEDFIIGHSVCGAASNSTDVVEEERATMAVAHAVVGGERDGDSCA